jgi:endonuclease/exonuclease/phosphatase (EEP) superfamily protein YafD
MLKPRRPYGALIHSLSKVWRIREIRESEAFLYKGEASISNLNRESIRLAVWNLCKGSGGYQFEHDFRSICRRNDLILTQEALLSPRSIKVFEESGFTLTHAASYERIDGLRDGVMTISRAPFIQSSTQRIVCKYPEPIFNTPKVALIQKIPLDELTEVLVVNIHATLVRSVAGAIDEINHIIGLLPNHTGPIIFAGDFNTFSLRYLRAIEKKLGTIGLDRVIIVKDPRPKTQALDQIFVRGFEIVRASVEISYFNSDHFPLFAELKKI